MNNQNKLGLLDFIVILLTLYVLGALVVDTFWNLPEETTRLLNYFDYAICAFFFFEFLLAFHGFQFQLPLAFFLLSQDDVGFGRLCFNRGRRRRRCCVVRRRRGRSTTTPLVIALPAGPWHASQLPIDARSDLPPQMQRRLAYFHLAVV